VGSNPTPGATLAEHPDGSGMPTDRSPEFLHELRLMKWVTLAAGVTTLAFDLALNYMGAASVWEAAILTPGAVILLMLSLVLHDSATSSPWAGHFRVESEFRRAFLMVFGAVLVTIGGGFALGSFGGDVSRVTVDMGGGTTLVVTGLYIALRYRW